MSTARVLLTVLLAGALAPAQEEVTTFSANEIELFLENFKDLYNKKASPEEDAIAILDNLKKAYVFLGSRGAEKTKEDEAQQRKIVATVCRGLNARERPLVTVNCATALGEMGDAEAAKPLLKWMEKDVLKAKSVHPNFVEHGFLAMAWIGGDDKAALELLREYATGKHMEASVASHALKGVIEWKQIPGKDRRELFEKILMFLQSLHSQMSGGDVRLKGAAEQKFNAVKDNGIEALSQLSGEATKFADLAAAQEWWKEGKKIRKWEDYVGPRFRGGAKPEAAPTSEEPKPEGEPEGEPEKGDS
jgi:hypothetical protein